MIGFILQTTILFSVLYYFPILGELKMQMGTTSALVVAILLTGILNFVFDLFYAPILLDRYQRQDLKTAIITAKEIIKSEGKIKYIGELYNEGKALHNRVSKEFVERDEYNAWFTKCEKYIEDNFEFSELHKFRNSAELSGDAQLSPHKMFMYEIRQNLNVLDNIIEFSNYKALPLSSLQHIILNSEEPAYKYIVDLSDN